MPAMPRFIVLEPHLIVPVTARLPSPQEPFALKELFMHVVVVTPVHVSSKVHAPRDALLGLRMQFAAPFCVKVAVAVPSPLPISSVLNGLLAPPGSSSHSTLEPVKLSTVTGMPQSKQKSGL